MNNGYEDGVQKYRNELLKEASNNPRLGTCFHNGTKVCETVSRWHDKVRQTIRISDSTSIGVLKHVEDDMLLLKPEIRLDPNTLWNRAEGLLLRNQQAAVAAMTYVPDTQYNTNGIPAIAPHTPTSARTGVPHPHRSNPATRPATLFPNFLRNITQTDQEVDCQKYLQTHKYLQEQTRIGEKCKEILSLLSDGEKSLKKSDPQSARLHFDKARSAVYAFDGYSKMLEGVTFELHQQSWTGVVKCELAIIDQVLSKEEKKEHLQSAQRYAKSVFEAQKKQDPERKTCDALDLVEKKARRLR